MSYRSTLLACGLLACGLLATGAGPCQAAAAAASASLLPDRYLSCDLGRSTNIDPAKGQTTADIVSQGHHRFALRLPPIAMHVGAAPDPSDAPDPVDPRTKILTDADGLTAGVSPTFARVVDLWPKRVEMLSAIAGSSWMHVIILDPIDPARGRAHLFMSKVKDAATIDLAHVYQGECRVGDAPAQMSGR